MSQPVEDLRDWVTKFPSASHTDAGQSLGYLCARILTRTSGARPRALIKAIGELEQRVGEEVSVPMRACILLGALNMSLRNDHYAQQLLGSPESALRQNMASTTASDLEGPESSFALVKQAIVIRAIAQHALPILQANEPFLKLAAVYPKLTNTFGPLCDVAMVQPAELVAVDLRRFESTIDYLEGLGHKMTRTSNPNAPATTALHTVASFLEPKWRNQLPLMTALLDRGCDPIAIDELGLTPARRMNAADLRESFEGIVRARAARSVADVALDDIARDLNDSSTQSFRIRRSNKPVNLVRN